MGIGIGRIVSFIGRGRRGFMTGNRFINTSPYLPSTSRSAFDYSGARAKMFPSEARETLRRSVMPPIKARSPHPIGRLRRHKLV